MAEVKEKPLSIKEAMEFTGYARSYIYKLIHWGKLPAHKPTGGKLFFKKSELEEFVFRGKKDADYEVSQEADAILNGERK